MHARVTTVQIRPGMLDEAIAVYQDSVAPAAQQQPGCRGIYLLTDRDSGKGISITFWDSEADMTAGESSGYYQEQLGKFKDIFAGPPQREAFRVSVQA